MRKHHVLSLALMAMFVFGAFTAASAFGELVFSLAAWLVNGAAVTTELAAETEGELLLENTSNKGAVHCSAILDGFIGPNSLDLITKVLDLNGNEVDELTLPGLLCEADEGSACEKDIAGEEIEVWPDEILPNGWPTELELDLTDNTAWILIFGAGWEVLCTSSLLLIHIEELCKAAEGTAVEAINNAGGSDVEIPAGQVAEPLGNCGTGTGNGLEQTVATGLERLALPSTESLQISE